MALQDLKALSVCLVLAYCVWDEANYQKCYFRAELRGQLIRRDLFPTFRHIENPKYIKCEQGLLLTDGWRLGGPRPCQLPSFRKRGTERPGRSTTPPTRGLQRFLQALEVNVTEVHGFALGPWLWL